MFNEQAFIGFKFKHNGWIWAVANPLHWLLAESPSNVSEFGRILYVFFDNTWIIADEVISGDNRQQRREDNLRYSSDAEIDLINPHKQS